MLRKVNFPSKKFLTTSRRIASKTYARVRAVYKGHILSQFRETEPIFILGLQKSGTTAIAALLAEASGVPATLDITRAIKHPGAKVLRKYGVEGFDDFIYRYRKEFSKKIIKEPGLTFDYRILKEYFPKARFIMVVREPRDNIRSILNRLQIPGHYRWLDANEWPELKKSPAWRINLDSSWLGHWPESYVDSLAYRWRLSAEIYLNQPEAFTLMRYEDFKVDKKNSIEQLARALELEVVSDISRKVNNQYQPAGQSVTDYKQFYGENEKFITAHCDGLGSELGYQKTSS